MQTLMLSRSLATQVDGAPPWKCQCPLSHDRQKRNTEGGERANQLERGEGRASAAEEPGLRGSGSL